MKIQNTITIHNTHTQTHKHTHKRSQMHTNRLTITVAQVVHAAVVDVLVEGQSVGGRRQTVTQTLIEPYIAPRNLGCWGLWSLAPWGDVSGAGYPTAAGAGGKQGENTCGRCFNWNNHE